MQMAGYNTEHGWALRRPETLGLMPQVMRSQGRPAAGPRLVWYRTPPGEQKWRGPCPRHLVQVCALTRRTPHRQEATRQSQHRRGCLGSAIILSCDTQLCTQAHCPAKKHGAASTPGSAPRSEAAKQPPAQTGPQPRHPAPHPHGRGYSCSCPRLPSRTLLHNLPAPSATHCWGCEARVRAAARGLEQEARGTTSTQVSKLLPSRCFHAVSCRPAGVAERGWRRRPCHACLGAGDGPSHSRGCSCSCRRLPSRSLHNLPAPSATHCWGCEARVRAAARGREQEARGTISTYKSAAAWPLPPGACCSPSAACWPLPPPLPPFPRLRFLLFL